MLFVVTFVLHLVLSNGSQSKVANKRIQLSKRNKSDEKKATTILDLNVKGIKNRALANYPTQIPKYAPCPPVHLPLIYCN